LQALCDENADIFSEIPRLPPKRANEHQIPLVERAEPVNLRPYRHPWEQKNAIEKMIEEMLDSRIIRNNRSPYMHPLLSW